jgi:A/G-specific adenine glycosylase
MDGCTARRRGDPEAFPVKAPKATGRLRRGAAFVALRGGTEALVRTRPEKGLLGGMTEVPGSDWGADFDEADALAAAPPLRRAAWRRVPGTVTHVFTHFPLELAVWTAQVPGATAAPAGMRWVPIAELAGEALPNLMRKVIAHAGIDAPDGRRP